MNHTILNIFSEHPFKREINSYKIKQYDLAKSVGISQSSLSKMLAGVEPMSEIIQDEIQAILTYIKEKDQPTKKSKRIIKRA